MRFHSLIPPAVFELKLANVIQSSINGERLLLKSSIENAE
ncbi:hypothetical protein CSC36_3697 [Pseudomonas aeruginosa]|nr:hypothetical protein CSC36_3697 [Pseudomonas aeruginosa]